LQMEGRLYADSSSSSVSAATIQPPHKWERKETIRRDSPHPPSPPREMSGIADGVARGEMPPSHSFASRTLQVPFQTLEMAGCSAALFRCWGNIWGGHFHEAWMHVLFLQLWWFVPQDILPWVFLCMGPASGQFDPLCITSMGMKARILSLSFRGLQKSLRPEIFIISPTIQNRKLQHWNQ
jgi:hypothetical protein